MNLQQLHAYIGYRRKAKHRHGHGVHSPFMYALVRSVFSARKEKGEPHSRQERIRRRLSAFCEAQGLKLLPVKEMDDLILYEERCIALLAQPHANAALWRQLQESRHTKVTADCWTLGLALAVPHLQRQQYVVKI